MPRHHTIGYPQKWIEEVIVDGEVVTAGYWQAAYQEDVDYTPEEESERDAEEVRNEAETAERRAAQVRLTELHDKLAADTITDVEIREMLRMERGI